MDKNPLVSVIIVNFNGKNLLEKCLKSLMQVTYKKFEVILVDNNSTDESIEFVKNNYPSIIIIKLDKNYGFAEPSNIGAKNAKGEYLLFLNNDTKPTPDFISEMVDVLEKDQQIAICQSLLLQPNGEVDSSGDFIDHLGRAYRTKTIPKKVKPIFSARGASMLVRRNVFLELGGFDKKFFTSFEDVDLGWRTWISGYSVVITPTSIVYHKGGQTVQEMSSEIKFHGVKNTLILSLANFETLFAIKSIFRLLLVSLMKKSLGLSDEKEFKQNKALPSFRTVVRGILWTLKNWKYILEKRKQVNSTRVRSTEELIKMNLIKNIR